MEILYCAVCALAGVICGRLSVTARLRKNINAESYNEGDGDSRELTQFGNFLCYDGSEEGQSELYE